MSYYQSISLWIIKIGLWIVPFIPLYVSRSLFFPYITGKAFIFRAIVEIAFLLWLYLAIFYTEYRPRRGLIGYAVLFFVFTTLLAAVFGENPAKSFWSNFERMEGVIAYIHLAAYFFVLAHVFDRRDWKVFFNIFVIAGMLENTYALFQKLGLYASPQGGARVDGTIGNPTYLAAYLLFVATFCGFLLLETKKTALRLLYGAGLLFTLLIIYFTASRGPILALLGGGLFIGIAYIIFKKASTPSERLYKKILFGGLLLLAIVVGTIWSLRNTTFIKGTDPQYTPILARLTSLSFTDRTITSRFTIWSMGWEGFKEHPILGWGPDNYGLVFSKYYKPELWAQEPWFDRSHNIVLDWLINGGIVGFIGYFGMLVAAFFCIVRSIRSKSISFETGLLFSMALLVYLIQNLFVFDQIATYIGLFTVLAYIHATSPEHAQNINSTRRFKNYQPIILISFIIVNIMVFALIIIYPLRINLNLLDGLRAQGQSPEMAFESFKKALNGGFLGRTETREQFIMFAIGTGNSNLPAEFKDSVLRRALEEAEKNVAENKQDPRSYLFLGGLYARLSASNVTEQNKIFDLALKALNDALALSPKKQQIYFEIAEVYLKKKELANSIKYLKFAYDLDPQYRTAYMNLISTYIFGGNQAKADELLLASEGTVDVLHETIAQTYSRLLDEARARGDKNKIAFYADRIARIWNAYIKAQPYDFNHRRKLAFLYFVVGETEKANEVLQEAIRYNPAFESDVKEFVEQTNRQIGH